MSTEAILIDTETNTFAFNEPIEVGWMHVSIADRTVVTGDSDCRRFKPDNPISSGAVSVHGILPEELEGKDPSCDAIMFVPDCEYWIGHKIDYDWEALGSPDVRRICTLALARSIWPGLESYKQAALAYELWGMNQSTRERLKGVHGAVGDVEVLSGILAEIVKKTRSSSMESLWQASEDARVPTVMAFGKHRGEPISKVPYGYMQWLLKQDDVDPYLRKALMKWLPRKKPRTASAKKEEPTLW